MSEPGKKLRLAVLVSGGGTNLQAMLDRSVAGLLNAEVVVVASDRREAFGLERARRSGIPTHVVNYAAHQLDAADHLASGKALPQELLALDSTQQIYGHPDPEVRLRRLFGLISTEQELIGLLDRYQPDCVCLAGYMRLLTPHFLQHYRQGEAPRVINIHPALLPAFPGQHGYEDTFGYGCRWGGITVHFVDEGEDTGPVIAQAVYPIWPDDTIDAVRQRGLQLEYEVYSQVINWLAAGQIAYLTGPGKRPQTRILDPAYPEILRRWLDQTMKR